VGWAATWGSAIGKSGKWGNVGVKPKCSADF
jgi:hypothetical protein